MRLCIFDLVAEMIADLPAQAIFKALTLECKMLEDDQQQYRPALPEDAYSVLCFWKFMGVVKLGRTMCDVKPLPLAHIEFYKKTIVRLVEAEELPPSAMAQFDSIFVKHF